MAGSAPHIPGCRDLSLIGERVARSLFSAYSDRLARAVTVTVFPPLAEGRTRDQFDRAATTAQRLGAHPSVLTIHEWGQAADGRPWIITDPQPAESVDVLLTLDGPLEIERALQVGILLAGALETAHRAGIVHGDLQPARLVFGNQGEPLLVETGLAPFAVFPGLGALNNPVRYHAPPEVLERTEVSPATDVYSLGSTVYAMLAGRAPHQKPAEVTDSNASLLLRILQMAVPPIRRPGLPSGLDDALRGPLSASPGKRPQQAIEVAWLLQDVQRRGGLPVTEPVVLDLDDIDAAGPGGASGGRSGGAGDDRSARAVAPPDPPGGRESSWSLPAAGLAGAGAAAGSGFGADDVLPPPTIFPFAEGGDANGGGNGDTWPPAADPVVEPAAEAPSLWAPPDDAPADSPWSGLNAGSGGLWPTPDEATAAASPWGPPPADAPAESPWPTPADESPWGAPDRTADTRPDADQALAAGPWSAAPGAEPAGWPGTEERRDVEPTPADEWPAAPATEGADTLWPSTWPATGDAASDLPEWAAPPAGGDGPAPEHAAPSEAPSTWAAGGDGGSIADPAPAAGEGGTGPLPFGATPTDRPAELDELPAWYTDPLPNEAPPANGNGAFGAHHGPADLAPGWPGDDGWGQLPSRPGGSPNGHPRAGTDPGAPPPAVGPWAGDPSAGAAPAPDHGRLPGAGDELRFLFGEVVGEPEPPARYPAPPGPSAFDDDPLGPPETRPPIDLGQLDRPLGPAPYLPPSASAAEAPAADRPTRLPRRHEPPTWPSPAERPEAPARLPRASEVAPPFPTRTPRPGPRQVAGADAPRPGAGGLRASAAAGPPALPVVILVAVVVVLALGVAWLVLTGDDAGTPATDRDAPATEQSSGDAGGAAPADVTVREVPEGVQVSWSGTDEAEYVVTVLSATAPPEPLPPTRGASALVPNVEGAAAGGRCFTVAVAGDEGAPAAPSSAPACTAGASIEQMNQG